METPKKLTKPVNLIPNKKKTDKKNVRLGNIRKKLNF